MVYGPPLDLPDSGSAQDRAWEITRRATVVVESWVRDHPESWLWQHNRWKDQPREPAEKEAVARLQASGRLAKMAQAAE